MPDLLHKAQGCILGAAVGDAFGMPLEFSSRREAGDFVEEMRDGFHLAGTYTDDTEMMLALAQSLLHRKPLDPSDLAHRFVGWYHTNPPDIGIHTRQVLELLDTEAGWQSSSDAFDKIKKAEERLEPEGAEILRVARESGSAPHERVRRPVAAHKVQEANPTSASNGSLMRCFPVALAYHDDLDACARDSRLQSHVTHAHEECLAACAFVNVTIAHHLRGADPSLAVEETLRYFLGKAIRMTIPLEQAIRRAPQLSREDLPNTGWVRHTVESAVWALLTTSSYRDAIVQVANLGGDADTAAAVTGALAGAAYGVDAIPSEWRDTLQGASPVAGDKFWRAADFTNLADELLALSGAAAS